MKETHETKTKRTMTKKKERERKREEKKIELWKNPSFNYFSGSERSETIIR